MAKQVQALRSGYTVLLPTFMLSLLVAAALVGLNFYQFSQRPSPQYAATTANGHVVPLQPYSSSVLTQPQLLEWAQRAIIASNNYGFARYQKQLDQASRYYATDGWEAFMRSLQQSGRLQMVIDNRVNMHAVATSPPDMIDQSLINGHWLWKIHLPIMLQYVSDPTTVTEFYDVIIRVQKDDNTLMHPKGVSVVNYRMTKGNNPSTIGNP